MNRIGIKREALDQVELALAQYQELLAKLEETGVLKENTRIIYHLHSENFVRRLKGEFDPGARNKT